MNKSMGQNEQYQNFNSVNTAISKLCRIAGLFFLSSVMAVTMAVFRFFHSGKIIYTFYIWNLFLAWIPFGISLMIYYISYNIHNRNKIKTVILYVLTFIWLVFYPNAPYIVTDYIHINVYHFAFKIKDTLEFGRNFWIWYDFILISIFAWIGFIMGFVSLYLNQILVKKRLNTAFSWIYVFTVLLLASFGIYLGRFVRWNSWDIFLNPLLLLKNIIRDFRIEAIIFSLVFSIFLLITYCLLYGLTGSKFLIPKNE